MSTRNQNQSNYFDVYQRTDKAVTKSKLEPNLCSDQEEKNVRNTTELKQTQITFDTPASALIQPYL